MHKGTGSWIRIWGVLCCKPRVKSSHWRVPKEDNIQAEFWTTTKNYLAIEKDLPESTGCSEAWRCFWETVIYCSRGLNRQLSGKRESQREKQDPFSFKWKAIKNAMLNNLDISLMAMKSYWRIFMSAKILCKKIIL